MKIKKIHRENFFSEVSREGRERLRGMSLTSLDKWLKKTTPDDTGLTRPPVVYYFIYCETPPVNYLFTVGHPPEVIIIVPIVLPGTVILPVMCRKLYDIHMTGSLYTHDVLMSTKSCSEISKYKL
jgi:hypothetical protein